MIGDSQGGPKEMGKVRLLIADDHQILRGGLRALLEREPDMQVVAEASDGREALRLAEESRPDVAVLDIGMPELNGIEAAKQLRKNLPGLRIIALSMHSDRRFVVEMLRSGASCYVLKDAAPDELVHGIREALAGRVFLGTGVANVVVDEFLTRLGAEAETGPVLTEREREVVQLIAEGAGNKQIAAKLFISVRTVESHRANIMQKLGLRTVAELTKYAVREGLTSLD